MEMRVLLVSANTEQINMAILPVGLACVAAATESTAHEVRFLNHLKVLVLLKYLHFHGDRIDLGPVKQFQTVD
jgi:hypothetical protein